MKIGDFMKKKLLQVTLDLYEADMIHLSLKETAKHPDEIKLLEQWASMVEAFAEHTCQENGYETPPDVSTDLKKSLQKKHRSSQSKSPKP